MMIKTFLEKAKALSEVTEIDVSSYRKMKKNGCSFLIHDYELKGYGRFSTIEMKAMFSLMKMETIVFTPLEKEMPLLSYDLISAFSKHTLLLELYDTKVDTIPDLSRMDSVKEKYSSLKDNIPEKRWYDSMKLSPTLSKKGGKKKDYEALASEWISSYFQILSSAPNLEKDKKREKTLQYVDGLFANGGPSTEQFSRMFTKEVAYNLFTKYIFNAKQ